MMRIKSLQRGLVSASNEKEWVEKPRRERLYFSLYMLSGHFLISQRSYSDAAQ